MSIKTDACACCKKIWNYNNLESINLGKHKLYLCPDCFKEYSGIVKRAYTDGQKNPSQKYRDWLHG